MRHYIAESTVFYVVIILNFILKPFTKMKIFYRKIIWSLSKLCLTRPIGLPPNAPVARKIADQRNKHPYSTTFCATGAWGLTKNTQAHSGSFKVIQGYSRSFKVILGQNLRKGLNMANWNKMVLTETTRQSKHYITALYF